MLKKAQENAQGIAGNQWFTRSPDRDSPEVALRYFRSGTRKANEQRVARCAYLLHRFVKAIKQRTCPGVEKYAVLATWDKDSGLEGQVECAGIWGPLLWASAKRRTRSSSTKIGVIEMQRVNPPFSRDCAELQALSTTAPRARRHRLSKSGTNARFSGGGDLDGGSKS